MKKAGVERVRRSVWNLEGDPQGHKTFLRLVIPTVVTTDINKGKGLVYEFSEHTSEAS